MTLRNVAKSINWKLLVPAFLLTIFGLISIYSICYADGDFLRFKKQLIFLGIGIILVIAINLVDLRVLKTNSYLVFILYLLSLFSLGGLLVLGAQIRGVQGWYALGPVSFDPVPFSAIILIIVLAKYFSTRHIETTRFKPIILSAVYFVLPFALVFLQPDLGSALLFIAIWIGIIIFSGIKFKHFAIIALVFLLVAGLAWQLVLQDYQKERVLTFLNQEIDSQDSSWNINQSQIAIGSGGLLGKGITKGSQVQHGFLPAAETDFIFASIAEETGFVGVSILIFLFIFLFWQIIKIVFKARYNFTRLFASGLAFLLLSQAFINIGMNLGVVPIIGLPLPFVSYSGSSLLAFYISLGILHNISQK